MISGASKIMFIICLAYVSCKWFMLVDYFIRMKKRKNVRRGIYPPLSKQNILVIRSTYTLSTLLILVHLTVIVMTILTTFEFASLSDYFMYGYLTLSLILEPLIYSSVAGSLIYLFTFLSQRKYQPTKTDLKQVAQVKSIMNGKGTIVSSSDDTLLK